MTIPSNGCYTTFRCDITRADLIAHYNRLVQTSQKLSIEVNFKLADLQKIVENATEAEVVIIKVINTCGTLNVEYRDYHEQKTAKLKSISKPQWWTNLKLYPNVKQLDLLKQAQEQDGVDDYLLVADHQVLETVIANIFYVKNNILYTPKLNESILPGTTRKRLLEKFDVRQTTISLVDIYNADFVFICNAVRGIVVVSQIDEQLYDISDKVKLQVAEYQRILNRKVI
ncbi:aminotransferase class IV [Mollicutes bacterium LVI A0039]|nr:aminotransferase class IV [Mollicutes bacterium LVI A0039]